uniref:Cilia- and flagella-associated protein 206 n=1 Tax=Trypanosoma vivax (strain Y486) TaxID=1055687 RepID=G0U7F6_TRYVY|nr:conserved hypothetical protein, fragment [Trypanosoma vivax Y486]
MLPSALALETLEDVQLRLWGALPTVAGLRASLVETAVPAGPISSTTEGADKETAAVPDVAAAVKSLAVPFDEVRQLAECLFMACHMNPINEDVDSGVQAVLGKPEERSSASFVWDEFVKLIQDIESQWLEWADMKQKWLAVTERQHIKVMQELADAVTQDVEPFLLLPRDKVLTLRSSIVRAKKIDTLFETFVKFAEFRDFPEVYDKLWELLMLLQGGSEGTSGSTPLELGCFTEFFKWFYLPIFANASVEAAAIAARTLWLQHLNAQGVMLKKQFVEACRHMCRLHDVGDGDDVQYFENLYEATVSSIQSADGSSSVAFFGHRRTPSAGRQLIDPNDLYLPEELDPLKQEAELYSADHSENRIIVHGRRGVGKTVLGEAVAKHLRCLHLSVEELAVAAMAKKSEEYTLGAELRKCAEDDAPVSLSLLSALVRERITSEETLYRGYVFSDVPYISKDDSSEGCQFFADCGLFSHFVPTVLVHLDCDDDTHAEYLSRALENAEAQRSEEEKLIEESNEDARRAELRKKIEQLKEEVARQEENKSPDGDPDPSPSEGDGAAAAGESAEDVSKRLQEALNELGPDDQQEEDADARREARDLRIKELRIRRLVRESLSRGYEPEKEVPVVTLPCFQSLQEKLQPLGRCLVLDPASNVDQSAAYIADSLQLNPCVLPQTVAELIGLDVKEAEIIKGDTDEGQTTQESALSAGAVLSGRWKQFCPVTFAETGMLVEGSAVYGCLFRRQLYHLASEEKLVKFKANPPAYVRATPIRRDPILLLSTVEPQNESHLPPDMVAELMRSLCEPLRLTSISFGDYVALWEKHRDLKGRRAQVRDARAKYDKLELKQREERLKKRIIQEQKRLKKLKASAKGKKGRAVPANVVVPEEEYRGWEEVPKEADTIAARIGKTLDEKCRRAKTFVPILVHAMDDIAMDAFEQLFNERVLPETVVVLRYEQPIEENDGDKAGAPPDNETGEGSTTVARPQTKALSMLRGEEGESSSLIGSSAQTFSIHEIIINDKDAGALLTEILQAVSPAMEPVTDGVVDSSLEEVSDEEAEVDDDEDEEDEENMLGVFDQSVRPGRRFLNQFGMTLHYCPVTIHEKGLLMRGQNDLCLEYRRKLYLFRTPDEKAKFQTNPLRYLTFPPHSPPCSVWIVGCSKSGKKTLAKSMGEKYNVPYFCYSRELFEKCIEAAQTPGGATVAGIHIPEQSFSNPYFARARDILKGLREFAEEQQRCMKLRQQAEEEMERRQQAAENDEEDEEEVDEEAEARLQEYLEFEPEDPEDRELRLSESYLKIAGCTIHMEPFVSKGYIMVCPPFSGGDMEVLSSVDAIPEVALQIDVSEDIYLPRNLEALAHKRKASPSNTPTMEDGPPKTPEADGVFRKWSEELMRKEREVQKWRRRHIGKDDPESDLEDDNVLDELDNAGQQDNEDLDNTKRLLIVDRVSEEEAITEFAESMEELLVPLVKLNGDLSKNAVFRVATRQLYKVLEHRRSLMYVAEIVRYDDAERMLESGEASLSCFRYTDPVALYDMRHGVRRVYRWIPSDGYMEEAEEEPQDGFAVAAATPADENQPAGGGEVPQTENDSEPSQLHDQEGYETTANEPDFSDEEMSEQDSEIIGEVRRKYEGHRRREWLRHAQRVALFCGRLYFFDTDAAFLLQPCEIAFPSGSQLLPQTIPVRTDLAAGCALELEGCCPVLLYDTRENRGLRGVLEPVARKGDLKCVVEYDGRYYALLDEGSLERFLMRPWQYIGGAQLPPSRKVPLPEGKTMKSVPEEEFIRRALYDSVAHALIAVAKARPMYLGLSVEESALKYIALHMKSFNSKNTAIQAEQYKNNFEVFDKRSTLYRTLVEAADNPSQNKTFVSLCKEWDAMRVEGDNGVASLVTLHVGGEGVD